MKLNEKILMILNDEGWTMTKLSLNSGVSLGAVKRFLHTGKSTIDSLEAMVESLGYEVVIKKRGE